MRTKLTSDNIIINSGLHYWQRGTSFASLATTTTFLADRFQYTGVAVTSAITASQQVPDGIVPIIKIPYSMKFAVTTAMASLNATSQVAFNYKIEGRDLEAIRLSNGGFSISFYVKAFRAGQYTVQLLNSGSNMNYSKTFNVSASGVWQRIVLIFPALATGGTWDYTTGMGLQLKFFLCAGTSIVGGVENTWGSSTLIPNGQVNGVTSTSDYFEITGLETYAGQFEKDFEIRGRDLNEELELCQRYFEKSYELDVAPGSVTGVGSTGITTQATNSYHSWNVFFNTTKRSIPIATSYGIISSSSGVVTRSSPDTNIAASITDLCTSKCRVQVSNVSVSGTFDIRGHWTANAEF